MSGVRVVLYTVFVSAATIARIGEGGSAAGPRAELNGLNELNREKARSCGARSSQNRIEDEEEDEDDGDGVRLAGISF
jgi:hypothetical protein